MYRRNRKSTCKCAQRPKETDTSLGAPTNDRHSLALVAEVQKSQQLVNSDFPHFDHCDCLRCAGTEHKAKVPRSSDQGTFIW